MPLPVIPQLRPAPSSPAPRRIRLYPRPRGLEALVQISLCIGVTVLSALAVLVVIGLFSF